MGIQQEAVVRSWLDCFDADDLDAAVDHYSDDAAYHVSAWNQPVVGREAIRAELCRQFGVLSDYRHTIRNIASRDAVVFIEVVDAFKHDGKDFAIHWSSVQEIDPAGKITAQRDYWHRQELEAQLA